MPPSHSPYRSPLPARAPVRPDPWASHERVVERSGLERCSSVLVVAAHPDDESIGAGRLLADLDLPARAVTLTSGEACFRGTGADEDALVVTRLAEWQAALGHLEVTPLAVAGLPDGALADHEAAATEILTAWVAPGDGILAPWRHDPHPDHAAAGRAAARLARMLNLPLCEYVVWAPSWLTPGEVGEHGSDLALLPTSPAADEVRTAALSCFPSQMEPWQPGWPAVVPPEALERHRGQWVVVDA